MDRTSFQADFQSDFQSDAEGTRKRRRKERFHDHVLGIDAEWVNGTHAGQSDTTNRILSYQLFYLSRLSGRSCALVVPVGGPTRRDRLTLMSLVSLILHKAISEGVIETVPERLALAGHFVRADFGALRDWPQLKKDLDGVRKTVATIKRPVRRALGDTRLAITVLDTGLLAPAGWGLSALGDVLGLPKVELRAGEIERMDLLLLRDPVRYNAYALRDAEIAARWTHQVWTDLAEHMGATSHSPTLGACGVKMLEASLAAQAIDPVAYFGYARRGRGRPQVMPCLAAPWSFGSNTYGGGRNEAFWQGFSPQGVPLSDGDLEGAYTTALSCLKVPAWDTARPETDLDRLAVVDEALTYACVTFRFPAGTVYPSLPILAGERGLVYPLTGQCWCCGPELVTARNQGAEITVESGWRIEWTAADQYPFADFARRIAEIRAMAQATGNPVLDLIAKEIGNCVYGKIAQAVKSFRTILEGQRHKSVFNPRKGQFETLSGSRITNPFLAAWVTSFVRATLSEALARLPADALVMSCTTDGLLSSVPTRQIDTSGPLATVFSAARRRLTGDGRVWKEKHHVDRVLITKTRGAFTKDPTEGDTRIIIARAGLKAPQRFPNALAESTYWISLHASRTYDTKLTRGSLIPLSVQCLENADVVRIEREVRVNMDDDCKRRLVDPRDEEGVLCAATLPHESVEEFHRARDNLENWKKSQRRVLKTRADYTDLQAWAAERPGQRAAGSTTQSRRPALVNWFIRAATRGAFGLGGHRYRDLAAFISGCGWRVTETTLKNAKRRGVLTLGQAHHLTEAEERFAAQVFAAYPASTLEAFAAEGSPALLALERLRNAARTGDTRPGAAGVTSVMGHIAQATPCAATQNQTGAKPLKPKGGVACARRPVLAHAARANAHYDTDVLRILRSGSRNPARLARDWERVLARLRC